ncbi:MAG: hypothetical protein QM754_06890 [Tepidisphaeraceae bacterium]
MPEPDASPPIALAYQPRQKATGIPIWVWGMVLLAVLLRVGFSLTMRSANPAALTALPDQYEYFDIADSIRSGQGIVLGDRFFEDSLYSYRMPAYPALIALLRLDVQAVRYFQAVLDGTVILAAFLAGQRLSGRSVGGLAAALVAANPFLVYFSSLILTETLFTAMLAWAVLAMLSNSRRLQSVGVALLLAAVYVRPSAAGLGCVSAACLVLLNGGKRWWLRSALTFAVAFVGLVLLLLPWALRNKAINGRLIWLTTNDGFTAYDSFNPKADGSSNQADFRNELLLAHQTRIDQIYQERFGFSRPRPTTAPQGPDRHHVETIIVIHAEVERSDELSARAWQYARENPGRVVSLAFAKLGRFWAPWPLSADFGGKWYYVAVGAVYTVPLFVFAAVGVWRGRMPWRAKLILLLPALYFSAVHSVFVGSLRYRVPCDVPLAVLAAAGVVSCVKSKEPIVGDVV